MKRKQTMMRAAQVLAALMLAGAAALTFTGCTPTTDGGGDTPPETAATPTANPAAGAINPAQAISLATATTGAVIHYTTDGSAPSAGSPAYTAPFTLTLPATVKAIAVKAGWNDSAVLTAAYTADVTAAMVVTALNLTALVTAPVKDAPPVTTTINQTQYTGTIAWTTGTGAPHTGAFAAGAVYKAELTLTAKTGYTLTGVAANSFTHSGGTVTNAANSGTVTITFPATAAVGADTIINTLSLDSLVTAPVKDATPVTTAINETQYTGTIAWTTNTGAAHSGAFAASTVYKAELTLTAKSGYTLTGIAANSFTYSGATVTNAANSGVVTITFPATTANGVNDPVTALNLTALVTAPVKDATPVTTAINETQYTGSIVWTTNTGAAHSGVFAAGTVYKAELTLTAESGFTFTGVAANSFTYSGATVTNAANSGVVTITFPATAAADAVVTDLNLTALVTAPVKDATPVTTTINQPQYSGTIAWKTDAGAPHSGAFAAGAVYKAEVTLTAESGFTFTGVAANSFTYTSATVTNAVNSGTVTITFPATAAADVVVSALNLTALVTAPAKDATPVTTAINETQYSGSIAWKTDADAPHTGAFAAGAVYKAEVTLTAKTGYTFTGVAANGFTHLGGTVTNAANSGTVTITFPATAAAADVVVTASNLGDLSTLVAAEAAAGGGATSADPIVVSIAIDDVSSSFSGSNSGGTDPLDALFDAIPSGVYVAYDLSGCTFSSIPDITASIANARSNKANLVSITVGDSVTSIGSYAFRGCSGLASVTIGDSVTSIGNYAFSGCSDLASVTIPDIVTSIGSSAFSGCSSLASVTIGDSVISIGNTAFYGCSSLASVTIGDSVTSIGNEAFNSCSSLASVTIPDSVTSIGNTAFSGCSSLASVTIGDSVISIGNSAFSGCSSLASVTIPDSVTSIGTYAFSACSSLASVTIGDSVTSIGTYAFNSCNSLATVTIGDSVTSIDNHAFYGCSGLTSVTIPASVTSIGYAFRNCSNLTSVYVLRDTSPLTTLGGNAFQNTHSSLIIYVPAGVVNPGYQTAANWSTYTSKIQAGAPPAP
ncbi:hypothetical protein AGMMS50267_05410 [Spirochaetia bacterium]|nr:hypothetical protein AGMMS50267_05410 [Spirochaetia bacterium]